MATVSVELPDEVKRELEKFVADGWAHDEHQVVVEAVQRFLAINRAELLDRYLRQDIEWGLNGSD